MGNEHRKCDMSMLPVCDGPLLTQADTKQLAGGALLPAPQPGGGGRAKTAYKLRGVTTVQRGV